MYVWLHVTGISNFKVFKSWLRKKLMYKKKIAQHFQRMNQNIEICLLCRNWFIYIIFIYKKEKRKFDRRDKDFQVKHTQGRSFSYLQTNGSTIWILILGNGPILKIIALIHALTLEKHPQRIDHFLGPVKI